ncbi:hypothetical protein E2C01_094907 [Portunus trituberculatus]|uniref:Uncharacterized protein n=1 Tax=Portunus trituberculatus TaxID=210409 RepID=A0A5B7JNE9_PORTR|nr:hypothetical protein [Portunus trituberculatus]
MHIPRHSSSLSLSPIPRSQYILPHAARRCSEGHGSALGRLAISLHRGPQIRLRLPDCCMRLFLRPYYQESVAQRGGGDGAMEGEEEEEEKMEVMLVGGIKEVTFVEKKIWTQQKKEQKEKME